LITISPTTLGAGKLHQLPNPNRRLANADRRLTYGEIWLPDSNGGLSNPTVWPTNADAASADLEVINADANVRLVIAIGAFRIDFVARNRRGYRW
jgi:hypothetical protein